MHHCPDLCEYALYLYTGWRGGGCDGLMTRVFQGLLIDRLGRRVLIVGGYFLMSVCCVGFTLSLTYQVTATRGTLHEPRGKGCQQRNEGRITIAMIDFLFIITTMSLIY